MKKLFTLSILIFGVFASIAQTVDFDKKLKEIGIELYTPTKPMGNYVKAAHRKSDISRGSRTY